jgi:hypothetical protein
LGISTAVVVASARPREGGLIPAMRELGFSAVGLIRKRDRDRLEKQSKRNGGGMSLAPTIAVAVVVSAVLHVQQTGGLTTGSLTHVAASHVASINATQITSDRVVVLVDNSGSMAGTEQTVQSQLQQLSAAGISIVNRVPVAGFAIASADDYSLLDTLLQGLAANPSADAVYVFSDFSVGDDAANDTAAYERLRMALHDRGARLYWSTVRDAPPPMYFALARDSGGDVIPAQ